MTTTAIVDPEVEPEKEDAAAPTPSPDESAAAQAFSEGFGETPESTPTPAPAAAEVPTPEPTAESEPAKPEYVQITKEDWEKTTAALTQLKDQLKHGLDSANGRLGSLQDVVQKRIAATPKGQKIQITAEDFAELKDEFPLLVESQLKGLNRVLEKLSGTGQVQDPDPEPTPPAPPIDEIAVKRAARQEQENIARQWVADEHEDWDTIVGLPGPNGEPPPETEFRKWVATKPEAQQKKIWSSWNPYLLSRAITEFKEHQQQLQTPKPSKPAQPDDADARRARLQSGVTPRSAGGAGGGSTAQTELQAFKEGFAS